jgi:DNA-binding HxlR family transcriptional regulator
MAIKGTRAGVGALTSATSADRVPGSAPTAGRRSAKMAKRQAPSSNRTASTAVVPAAPELEHTEANCRAHEMLKRVGDKWSVPVVHVLGVEGTLRFGELLRRIPPISQRMLAVTLRGLERDGLVRRTMYPEVPPRVEYALTPLGATLREIVRSLIDWSGAHLLAVDAARARFDQQARGWGATERRVDVPWHGARG